MASDGPRAVIRADEYGNLVLDDPNALAAVRAVDDYNAKQRCDVLLEANVDRVRHFERRIGEIGRTTADTLIVIVDVDDPIGSALVAELMPGQNWDAYRDRGEIPVARGLAEREGLEAFLVAYFPQVARRLAEIAEPAVLVVAKRAIGVYPASAAKERQR